MDAVEYEKKRQQSMKCTCDWPLPYRVTLVTPRCQRCGLAITPVDIRANSK